MAKRIRKQIGWLTVDEYQDVSPLQHLLMTRWLESNRNICVVGDPAQTIYSFAGATSYYLEHFGKEFAPLTADIALNRDDPFHPLSATRTGYLAAPRNVRITSGSNLGAERARA